MALQALGTGAALSIGVGVLASDAYAYHYDNVAPMSRMLAIEQVGNHFAGRGLILWNEFEEYAKYFADRARINVPFETLTPRQAQLLTPNSIYAAYYDLDDEQLSFVESFPIIVMRRSPSASRPPANYRLVYVNSYYEAWQRQARPVVLRHMPLQSLYSAAEPVSCQALRGFVTGAPGNSELVAAVAPFVSSFSPGSSRHTRSWIADPSHPDALVMHVPGELDGSVLAPRHGRYRLWVEESSTRGLTVELDGRKVGEPKGINTIDQWFSAGVVQLTAGPHAVRLVRGGGDLEPGDGGSAWIGPVAIAEEQPEHLERVPVPRWRSLCGRTFDWGELVAG
jgi:hypothetical protein